MATRQGVVTCVRAGDEWREQARGLEGKPATSVAARAGTILAGTHDGIYRSRDGGATWQAAGAGLTLSHVRWLQYHPDAQGNVFAGMEPAGLYVSRDDGDTWRAVQRVPELRDKNGWYLPYSPGAGCVRGFAFAGRRAYAAVEVGGVLRSDDGGDAWRMAPGSTGNPEIDRVPVGYVHPDVHSLVVDPGAPDLLFACTGGGFYRSDDGGASWARQYLCYCRAAWLDPQDPDRVLLGPAESVDRRGRVEESRDGGRTWQPACAGLSNTPWRHNMVERFIAAGDELLAVLSGGEVWATPLGATSWRRVLEEVTGVTAAAG